MNGTSEEIKKWKDELSTSPSFFHEYDQMRSTVHQILLHQNQRFARRKTDCDGKYERPTFNF